MMEFFIVLAVLALIALVYGKKTAQGCIMAAVWAFTLSLALLVYLSVNGTGR